MRSTRWTQFEYDRLSIATTARAATALPTFAAIQSYCARGIRGLDVRGGQAEAATLEDGPAEDHTTTMNATASFKTWVCYLSESISNSQFQLLSKEGAFLESALTPCHSWL